MADEGNYPTWGDVTTASGYRSHIMIIFDIVNPDLSVPDRCTHTVAYIDVGLYKAI